MQDFKIPLLLTEQHGLKHSGQVGFCESTGGVEFTLSPPEAYHCTVHDADHYGSTYVCLLQTYHFTGTDFVLTVQGQTHSDIERHSTGDDVPKFGAAKEELRLEIVLGLPGSRFNDVNLHIG